MKVSYSAKWILLSALMMPALTACSFFGDDEAKTEEVAASNEDAAAEPASEGEAVAEDNSGVDPTATAEEPVDPAADSLPNPSENAALAATSDPSADAGALPSNSIPPELLGANAAMETLPGNTEAHEAAPATPAPATPAPMVAAPGDARVYYVNVDSLPLRDKPSGQSVGSLSMGDPVLVKIEGNWANVLNRGWVELASLSMGPVGRAMPAKSWN